VTKSSGILDILLHPRLPPLLRPLPSMENVSLFRVEESEVEQELRAMLELAIPEDPEQAVPTRLPPQGSSKGPKQPAQPVELTSPPRSAADPAPPIFNPSNPPTQPSNEMQVDKTNIPPVTALPPDQTPVKGDPSLSNPTPSTIKHNEKPPPVSEPPQAPSWNPIGFFGDEDEEDEEEIPSINMDSDSD